MSARRKTPWGTWLVVVHVGGPGFVDEVMKAVDRVPAGRVASYGLIARVIGRPGYARHVGRAMRYATTQPWWRIVRADGTIALMRPDHRREALKRLRGEGVEVDERGRIDMRRFEWRV